MAVGMEHGSCTVSLARLGGPSCSVRRIRHHHARPARAVRRWQLGRGRRSILPCWMDHRVSAFLPVPPSSTLPRLRPTAQGRPAIPTDGGAGAWRCGALSHAKTDKCRQDPGRSSRQKHIDFMTQSNAEAATTVDRLPDTRPPMPLNPRMRCHRRRTKARRGSSRYPIRHTEQTPVHQRRLHDSQSNARPGPGASKRRVMDRVRRGGPQDHIDGDGSK